MPIAAARGLVVIEVTGPDRIEYLDNVTTQRFDGVDEGVVTGLLVLDGKGAPQAIAWALVGADAVTLLAPPAAADHVMEVVATRTFLAQVQFARRDLPVTSLAAGGETSDQFETALAAAELAVGADTWTAKGDMVVARHAFGTELVGATIAQTEDLGLDVDVVTADQLSIRSGEPRWGHEVVAGRLPEEYGLLATHVHLAKGCYPGQEPVAHMWMLGRPRRRLAMVEVAGAASAGDVVSGSDGDRGFAFVAPDTELGTEVADGVVVTDFVGAGRDVVGWTPAQTRRRDRGGSVDLPRRAP